MLMLMRMLGVQILTSVSRLRVWPRNLMKLTTALPLLPLSAPRVVTIHPASSSSYSRLILSEIISPSIPLTSPQAKCHKPSLLSTIFTSFDYFHFFRLYSLLWLLSLDHFFPPGASPLVHHLRC